ncbi:uncharacterized protein LOC135337638 [Halichondria panicea]|uniref:uncharacterized protein LOC135337638 n=1 Tax=Halichondria panicea TaxID=6063 RepID=UPI00312B2C39
MSSATQALIVLSSKDLPDDISFFVAIGFRQDRIYPADNPAVAILTGHGLQIQLDKGTEPQPATIHILTDSPESISPDAKTELFAPNGTKIRVLPKSNKLVIPPPQLKFEVSLEKDSSWVVGRAGMLYRDLVPSRVGGAFIASHIHIPNGGPVPDLVHFHTVRFQLIFCYKGWVKVVYEDQGEPFVLYPGDCVIQPPEIRHRVLESGDGLQVIEIGVPAQHMTTGDHNMELPTGVHRPEREFNGQRFCHHTKDNATWSPWRMDGFEFCDTGVSTATKGVASVLIARPQPNSISSTSHSIHEFDIHFTFLLKGNVDVSVEGKERQALTDGDAFTIPSNVKYEYSNCSNDMELLEVSIKSI